MILRNGLPRSLLHLLNQDGFIIFIKGGKEKGKTNFAMLLMEVCYAYDYRKHFATNINTQCYYVKQITTLPDLEAWLRTEKGKKLFVLDEMGKHLQRMRFMSQKNLKIMEIIQLIRHYDCGFVGIAPASRLIDSTYLDADIIDASIHKISKRTAKVIDYFNDDVYFVNDLPVTSIIHNSKDIADFKLEKLTPLASLRSCCQVARLYAGGKTFRQIGLELGLERTEVMREIRKHLAHTVSNVLQSTVEVCESNKNENVK